MPEDYHTLKAKADRWAAMDGELSEAGRIIERLLYKVQERQRSLTERVIEWISRHGEDS